MRTWGGASQECEDPSGWHESQRYSEEGKKKLALMARHAEVKGEP